MGKGSCVDCVDKHRGKHPVCPRCQSDETRRLRNYGYPVANEWWCLDCGRRWDPATAREN